MEAAARHPGLCDEFGRRRSSKRAKGSHSRTFSPISGHRQQPRYIHGSRINRTRPATLIIEGVLVKKLLSSVTILGRSGRQTDGCCYTIGQALAVKNGRAL